MSYQEKRSATSILTGLFVLAAYCFYAFGKYNAGAVAPDDLKFWAGTMLIFIAIGVGASIIIQIVFHILLSISIAMERSMENERCDEKEIEKMIKWEMIEDERDKLIELKAMKIGFFVAGIGFVGALVSLVLNYPPVVMLNILYISFSAGALFEGVGQIYYYRKGV
jgi:hypothetical protein